MQWTERPRHVVSIRKTKALNALELLTVYFGLVPFEREACVHKKTQLYNCLLF